MTVKILFVSIAVIVGFNSSSTRLHVVCDPLMVVDDCARVVLPSAVFSANVNAPEKDDLSGNLKYKEAL